MKTRRLQRTAILSPALVVALALICATSLPAQPVLTEAQAAALQPTPPNLVPRSTGTFWLITHLDWPPQPGYPYPQYPDLPTYLLPDGSWLVDDTSVPPPPPASFDAVAAARSLLLQSSLASQPLLNSSMLGETGVPEPPDPTNVPPPVPPSPPQLIPPPTPTNGTFWFLVESNWPPLPWNPCTNCDVYALSDGSYLVDDTSYTWPPPGTNGGTGGQWSPTYYGPGDLWLEITGLTNSLANLILHGTVSGTPYTILSRQTWSPSDPWDAEQPLVGAEGKDCTPIQIPTFGRRVCFFRAVVGTFTPTRLWLYVVGISNNCFNAVLHGTTEDTSYDLRSVASLTTSNNWAIETNFPGAAGQYWTPVSIPLLGRPSLFLSARSWIDSDGNGIPDWWEQMYFATNGVDPYALCPSGDGWTFLQAYQNGWNPNLFYTPPAPTGLTVTYTGDLADIGLRWNPSPGPVIGYTIERYIPESAQTTEFSLPPSATTYQDTTFPLTTLRWWYPPPTYRAKARYAPADSAWGSRVPLYSQDNSGSTAVMIRGPQGNPFLTASLPPNAATVRVEVYDSNTGAALTNWTLAASLFTNGPYAIPQSWTATLPTNHAWLLQVADSSSNIVARLRPNQLWLRPAPFYDGREQLKDNLSFLFRTDGDDDSPFEVEWHYTASLDDWFDMHFPTAYRFADMYSVNGPDHTWSLWPYEFEPFIQNNLFRNFTFAHADLRSDGYLNTGLQDGTPPSLEYPAAYTFLPPTGPTNIPSLLAPPLSQWTCLRPIWSDSVTFLQPGLIEVSGTNFIMSASATNLFGLPYLSAKLAWASSASSSLTLQAGQSAPQHAGYFYWETAQPDLQTVDYYFTALPYTYPWYAAQTPLPGETTFSPTNATPLLLTAVGAPIRVVGYARQNLRNGDPSKYAFLGQYFDKAYMANPDGTRSANQTGLLSEYGEFLPTEPGTVILTTKPDLTQTNNLQGECPVHVIKLALDMNHDGVMDLSLAGPDNTSQARPFAFWINDDYDRFTWDRDDEANYDDDVSSTSADAKSLFTWRSTPDRDYVNIANNRQISCARDLEDYPRLWVCGITSNLLSALPPGTMVTLSWGDVGNPNSANPTIDLFQAADHDGGLGYLTNQNVALNQVNPYQSQYFGRLGPGQSIQLNVYNASSGTYWRGDHYIWCGVSNGTGALTLTISQGGTNTLAHTSTYIHLQEIKDMYERWTVGDNPNLSPTNHARLAQEDVALPFQYGPPPDTNTPYILFVHGWNLDRWEKDRFAETAFKRLYLARLPGPVWQLPLANGLWLQRDRLGCLLSSQELRRQRKPGLAVGRGAVGAPDAASRDLWRHCLPVRGQPRQHRLRRGAAPGEQRPTGQHLRGQPGRLVGPPVRRFGDHPFPD